MIRSNGWIAPAAGLLLVATTLGSAAAGRLDELRNGGVTLFLRPAASDWSQEAVEFAARANGRFDARDCATQRNLSDEGRNEARALGLALKSLKLAILEVDAAALCRAVDTARLAFGEAKIIDELAPRRGGALMAARAALERIVKTPTPPKGLRIVVADYETAQALFGRTLGEGDALILKATPEGAIAAVAEIDLDDWLALAPVAQTGTGAAAPVKRF